MTRQKNMLVIGGILGALVLFALVSLMLIRGVTRLGDTTRKLEDVKRELLSYYDKDPFPSHENVLKESSNAKQVTDWIDRLLVSLGKGQSDPPKMTPAVFKTRLQDALGGLSDTAGKQGVTLAPDFGFGFAEYLQRDAQLPDPGDVERLAQQLDAIRVITEICLKNKIDEIVSVGRDVFEARAPKKRAERGAELTEAEKEAQKSAGLIDPERLYGTYRFRFDLRLREASLLAILNELASDPGFFVVRSMTMGKDSPDVKILGQEEMEEIAMMASSSNAPPSRRKRIVSGPEFEYPSFPMKVSMEILVCRFGDKAQ